MYNIESLIKEANKHKNTISMSKILDLNLAQADYEKLIYYLSMQKIDIVDIEIEEESTTNTSSFSLYMKDISKYPILTNEEEKQLLFLSHNGDKNAFNKLMVSNLKLVVSVAKKYNDKCPSLDILDLIQEGNFGLRKAIIKYDINTNYKLSTYAVWWIKQSIRAAIAKSSRLVKTPAHLLIQSNKFKAYRLDFYSKNGRFPTSEETSRDLKITLFNAQNLLLAQKEIVSLNAPISDTDIMLVESCADETEELSSTVESKIFLENLFLNNLKTILSDNEYKIILMRNGIIIEKDGSKYPMTLDEIAPILNISKERVRQSEAKAYQKILAKKSRYL